MNENKEFDDYIELPKSDIADDGSGVTGTEGEKIGAYKVTYPKDNVMLFEKWQEVKSGLGGTLVVILAVGAIIVGLIASVKYMAEGFSANTVVLGIACIGISLATYTVGRRPNSIIKYRWLFTTDQLRIISPENNSKLVLRQYVKSVFVKQVIDESKSTFTDDNITFSIVFKISIPRNKPYELKILTLDINSVFTSESTENYVAKSKKTAINLARRISSHWDIPLGNHHNIAGAFLD